MDTSIVISAKKPDLNYSPEIVNWETIVRDEKKSGGRIYWGLDRKGIEKTEDIFEEIFEIEQELINLNDVYVDLGLFINEDTPMKSFTLDSGSLRRLSDLKCKIVFSFYFSERAEISDSVEKGHQ